MRIPTKSITRSDACRSVIPVDADHRSERSDAGPGLCAGLIGMGQGWGAFGLSHRLSFQVEGVGVVHEAVEDGVGERGVTDDLVPVFGGELAGDQGRAPFVTVFEDFQEVAAIRRAQRRRAKSGGTG